MKPRLHEIDLAGPGKVVLYLLAALLGLLLAAVS